MYDRAGRSSGMATVVYKRANDARSAINDFDGQLGHGQVIHVSLVPPPPTRRPRSLFDRIERPSSPRDLSARARPRLVSDRRPMIEVDRYIPSETRGPRAGTPNRVGRRNENRTRVVGARREGPGRRGPRKDEQGHDVVGGRPRKTMEELDAEMADYWGEDTNGGSEAPAGAIATTETIETSQAVVDEDEDVIM